MKRKPRRIHVLAVLPARTLLLDIAGAIEVLRVANLTQDALHFDVRYCGPCRRVDTSIGLPITELAPLPDIIPKDAIVVLLGPPHRQTLSYEPIVPRIDAANEARTVDWLRRVIRPGHKVVCICTGALLAAKAGLLDGHACTTHHSNCEKLARIAPAARVQENRLFVEDGERYTSAGVTAGIDLMLHIVAQLTSPAFVLAIARHLVLYMRRSGGDPQLSPWFEGRNHLHPAVHRVQDTIAADPARPWTAEALARVAGASSRHLARLFREQAGMSVTDYRNRLRVALARELLGQTQLDMERIAERSGFSSSRHLRRAWHQYHEGAPSDVRRERSA